MKKLSFLIILVLTGIFSYGQDIVLTFAGSGAATTVDSVRIENFNSESVIVVPGNGSINLTQGTVNKLSDIDKQITNSLEIYPNPVQNSTNIQFYVSQTQLVDVQITDATGKIVAQINKEMPKGINACDFLPSSAGLYFVKVSGKNFSYSSKIISEQNKTTVSLLTYKGQISDNQKNTSLNKSKDVDFIFTAGDTLLLRASSGIYTTVMVVIPTVSTTYTFEFIPCTDYDGNNYAIVKIGNQIWMQENLRTTHYPDGTAIPYVADDSLWVSTDIDAFCWIENDSITYAQICGGVYNWKAAMAFHAKSTYSKAQGVCPDGWHLPSQDEWDSLINYVGGADIAGNMLKTRGHTSNMEAPVGAWYYPSNGTNAYGFSAKSSGCRLKGNDGHNVYSTTCTIFWTSSALNSSNIYTKWFRNDFIEVVDNSAFENDGVSVRCVKDND